MSTAPPMPASAWPLDECLHLLRDERDEKNLAGLLLAAEVCRAGDAAAVAGVYRAVGPRFIQRLIETGLGRLKGGKEKEEREAYLRIAVTVLAGFVRVPEVAADKGVISIMPLIAEIFSKSDDPTIVEQCFQLLSAVALASQDGTHQFCTSEVMDTVLLRITSLSYDSRCMALAINLMQCLAQELKVDNINAKKLQGFTDLVTFLTRISGVKSNGLNMPTTIHPPKNDKQFGGSQDCLPHKSQQLLPPGFRFCPTEVELVSYYLKGKVTGKKLVKVIADVRLYDFAPWDLPAKSLQNNDHEWFFFCPFDKKYSKGSRPNRCTPNGFWKSSGKDRIVSVKSHTIGFKKTLVFHIGKIPKGARSDWVMHEYRMNDAELVCDATTKSAYVLCKIFKKSGRGRSNGSQYENGLEYSDADTRTVPSEDQIIHDAGHIVSTTNEDHNTGRDLEIDEFLLDDLEDDMFRLDDHKSDESLLKGLDDALFSIDDLNADTFMLDMLNGSEIKESWGNVDHDCENART
ncbi:unnamed protein product [Urochloa humidicola]